MRRRWGLGVLALAGCVSPSEVAPSTPAQSALLAFESDGAYSFSAINLRTQSPSQRTVTAPASSKAFALFYQESLDELGLKPGRVPVNAPSASGCRTQFDEVVLEERLPAPLEIYERAEDEWLARRTAPEGLAQLAVSAAIDNPCHLLKITSLPNLPNSPATQQGLRGAAFSFGVPLDAARVLAVWSGGEVLLVDRQSLAVTATVGPVAGGSLNARGELILIDANGRLLCWDPAGVGCETSLPDLPAPPLRFATLSFGEGTESTWAAADEGGLYLLEDGAWVEKFRASGACDPSAVECQLNEGCTRCRIGIARSKEKVVTVFRGSGEVVMFEPDVEATAPLLGPKLIVPPTNPRFADDQGWVAAFDDQDRLVVGTLHGLTERLEENTWLPLTETSQAIEALEPVDGAWLTSGNQSVVAQSWETDRRHGQCGSYTAPGLQEIYQLVPLGADFLIFGDGPRDVALLERLPMPGLACPGEVE